MHGLQINSTIREGGQIQGRCQKRERGMDDSDIIKVLLVGDSPHSFSLVRQALEKIGCECHFAQSLEAAEELLRLWQFDVVLSGHGIPSHHVQSLVGLLLGSSVSLYCSLRVEEGSWWLPVLQFGRESYEPALTVREFSHVLEDLREQIRLEV
jgi:hypothetical protein